MTRGRRERSWPKATPSVPRQGAAAAGRRRVRLAGDVDPLLTLGPLWQGPGDPSLRIEGDVVLRATRTPAGAAAVRLQHAADGLNADAWGPGAADALAALPALLGEQDDPTRLRPRHRSVEQLARRFAGLRMARTGNVFEVLLPAIIAQKVSSHEARRSYRQLLRRFGEPAPGLPGLTLPPAPEHISNLPYHAFHSLGIERRRAETVRTAAAAAADLERALPGGADELRRRLLALPGVGAWTAAETIRLALGDPDALSVGDYNLPHVVSWALAGERRSTDERMLDLLEPYRGQRARVVLLLTLGGLYPPRRGPRLAARSIADL